MPLLNVNSKANKQYSCTQSHVHRVHVNTPCMLLEGLRFRDCPVPASQYNYQEHVNRPVCEEIDGQVRYI